MRVVWTPRLARGETWLDANRHWRKLSKLCLARRFNHDVNILVAITDQEVANVLQVRFPAQASDSSAPLNVDDGWVAGAAAWTSASDFLL